MDVYVAGAKDTRHGSHQCDPSQAWVAAWRSSDSPEGVSRDSTWASAPTASLICLLLGLRKLRVPIRAHGQRIWVKAVQGSGNLSGTNLGKLSWALLTSQRAQNLHQIIRKRATLL